MNVAILGASQKQERLAFLAQQRLVAAGHRVLPISPVYSEVLGEKCYPTISDIKEPIDTLTVYLSPDKLYPLLDEIIKAKPKRVILNPGSESFEVVHKLQEANLQTLEACTLVMLSASSF